jgi:CRP/FNR family transcriptional regulator, cyclic AMP receptor protein
MASTFLESLSESERSELLSDNRKRQWRKGEPLVRRGDPADTAIVLLDGWVKVHALAPEGVEVIFGFAGPGDLLGEISAVRRASRSATVTAIEPTTGLVVASLRAFLVAHPGATLALLDQSLARLYAADVRRIEFATSESLARVCARLIELAERFGVPGEGGAIDIALPINQEELASWSASSRESAARALRTLRDLGLIETARRRLTVRDLDGLRAHTAQL